jgi:hypothetical protein
MVQNQPLHMQTPTILRTIIPQAVRCAGALALILLAHHSARAGDGSVVVSGELKRWHKVTLTQDGPSSSESATPNPFMDYRMTVTFSNGSLSYSVPGYFAADGNAAESSATSGQKWRAHLSPDLTGTWTYTIDFRSGTGVAVNGGGTTLAPYHGVTGTFTIAETDKTGADLRGKGRLQYVNERYLKFKGNNKYFVKVGADAPKTFLAFADFDNTSSANANAPVKTYAAHTADWVTGDPVWKSTKGKGIIGAINYLAGKGMNVFSFMPYNAGGDGKNVWPYSVTSHGAVTSGDAQLRLDCSKLDQWEIVFEHATKKGFYLHFKTQETENDSSGEAYALDNGALGSERKLYYRELIARYGHHLALNWNLGEENTNTEQQRKDFAQ